ncbi:uncharacterized protein LOC135157006 [Lytechinus pictus]|uniref:uncharacterized protein LOC135157006 n=1 Tax=Lytechinus pictus TaxID=7653 RepID=UPI0030B9D457
MQMLKMGCVKGFKYFDIYMRGREEMICTIMNEDMSNNETPSPGIEKERFTFNKTDSGSFDNLPLEQRELMLSQNTQQKLSGFGYMDVGLPPASPSEREIGPINTESTLFLIAGYGKYNCPYVWVRSNHDRLVKVSDNPSFSKDSPLRLKSTSNWGESDVKVWQIIAELVKLCTRPAPKNPFEVNMEYFDTLKKGERVIALGAMVYFLQSVVTEGCERSFSGLVANDLREVHRLHLKEFQEVIKENALNQQEAKNGSSRGGSRSGGTSPRKPGGLTPRGPGVAVSQRQQTQAQYGGGTYGQAY